MALNNSWRGSLRAWGWYRGRQFITLLSVVSAHYKTPVPTYMQKWHKNLSEKQASIHSIAMCRMRRFLAVLSSFFHSSLLYTLSFHPSPPTIIPSSLTSSWHLFLGLPFSLVVSKFIYNTFFGNSVFFHSLYMPQPTHTILFPSILCTCPNQHTQFYFLPFSIHAPTNTHNSIFFHSLYIPQPTHTILFPSVLCTCTKQQNLFNLIVSVTVEFLTLA